MTTGGVDADIQELYTFATKSRQRSGGVTEVINAVAAVHLGHNVMGVVGASCVENAGAGLAKIIGDLEKSASTLTDDAVAASGAADEYKNTEQNNADMFNRMDTP